MTEPNELLKRLTEFKADWVARGWSWDNRFDCVASTFGLEEEDRARELVLRALPNEHNSKSIADAPALYQRVAKSTGGVRADQLLFAAGTEHFIAFGLWWPWGGEVSNRISMRMGLAGRVSSEHTFELRKIFNAFD